MSLFLTSDENVYGNDNTRTAFDNCIDQDFFARDGKNIALKEKLEQNYINDFWVHKFYTF